MKNFKKLSMSIGTIASIAAPIATTVACGSSAVVLDPAAKNSAVMIGGANGHDDKGFQQGAYDGIQDSITKKNGDAAWITAMAGSKLEKYSEVKAMNDGDQEASKAANAAVTAGGYSIWGAGFQFGGLFNTLAAQHTDRQFIAIDAEVSDKNWQPMTALNNNMTAISYKAEQSSFMMGVATAMWLNKNYATYSGDGGLKVAIYGGKLFGSVKDMMVGYYSGIGWFNHNLAIDNAHKVQVIKRSSGYELDGFQPNALGLSVAQYFVGQHADVMFPVAGGQVQQAVSAIKSASANTKLVGVDSDQSTVFGAQDGQIFIGSSLKDTRQTARMVSRTLFADPITPHQENTNTHITIGNNNYLGLDGDFVGITKATSQYNFALDTAAKALFKSSSAATTTSATDVYNFLNTDVRTIAVAYSGHKNYTNQFPASGTGLDTPDYAG